MVIEHKGWVQELYNIQQALLDLTYFEQRQPNIVPRRIRIQGPENKEENEQGVVFSDYDWYHSSLPPRPFARIPGQRIHPYSTSYVADIRGVVNECNWKEQCGDGFCVDDYIQSYSHLITRVTVTFYDSDDPTWTFMRTFQRQFAKRDHFVLQQLDEKIHHVVDISQPETWGQLSNMLSIFKADYYDKFPLSKEEKADEDVENEMHDVLLGLAVCIYGHT